MRVAYAALWVAVLPSGASAQFLRGWISSSPPARAAGASADAPLPPGGCRNTVQGAVLVADDAGLVCTWGGVNATGCCATAALEPCSGCDTASSCCGEFEHCVACCQTSSEVVASGGWATQLRAPSLATSGHWASAFDYCRGVCRHTMRGTVHENAYVDPLRHHCFGAAGFPGADSPPTLPSLGPGIIVVKGDEGASCDAACAAQKRSCEPAAFEKLNTCAFLHASFACEAGCVPGSGQHLPAYHSGAVADASTFCVTNDMRTMPTCGASAPYTRRLCPCMDAAAGSASAAG